MSAVTFLLFKLNTLHKETLTNRQTLSEPKPWCNDRGVLNFYHDNDVKRLFWHNPVSRGANQPIRKSEFLQCMKVEE